MTDGPQPGSLRGPVTQRILQRTVGALWAGVIPALLAALVLRFLVPPAGPGIFGLVGRWGSAFTFPLGIALFFVFAGLARYWRFRVKGGRYASALPAHLVLNERDPDRLASWAADSALYELAIAPAIRRRLAVTLAPDARSAIEKALVALREGLLAGDAPLARGAAAVISATGAPAFAARRRREALTTLVGVGAAAAAAVGLRSGVAQSYEVMSASMLPTLEPGDRVVGNKVAYDAPARLPRRGDVFVFRSSAVALPAGLDAPDTLVKRVIGLPGDRISMKGNQPIINGWAVPSCDAGEYVFLQSEGRGGSVHGRLHVEFLEDRAYLAVYAMGTPFRDAYEVKPGEVFVLGDNRGNSLDSRAWNGGRGGGVPLGAIDGRVQWFLIGTHRSGDADFSRLGHALDPQATAIHVEGLNTQTLRDGIAKCLANRPSETSPPSPIDANEPRASGAL